MNFFNKLVHIDFAKDAEGNKIYFYGGANKIDSEVKEEKVRKSAAITSILWLFYALIIIFFGIKQGTLYPDLVTGPDFGPLLFW